MEANIAITYIFKAQSLVDQVDEETNLKNDIAELLRMKGYKFILADDDYIDERYTKMAESEFPRQLTVEELQEMGGKPIWHQSLTGNESMWRILEKEIACRPEDYGYGERWLAYNCEMKQNEEAMKERE